VFLRANEDVDKAIGLLERSFQLAKARRTRATTAS